MILNLFMNVGYSFRASVITQLIRNLPAMQETWVWFLGREDSLEKEMATHFSILDWRIPWTEEPGRLQSIGLQESETTTTMNIDQLLIYSFSWFFSSVLYFVSKTLVHILLDLYLNIHWGFNIKVCFYFQILLVHCWGYRKETDFCKLTLCPANSLWLHIDSRQFLVNSLDFLHE